MKIIKTIYEYRYGSKEILSFLKNKIFKVFWRHNTAKDSLAFYEINREISDNIDSMFECLSAEYTVSHEMLRHSNLDVKSIVIEKLSRLIAEELFKNDKIIIVSSRTLYGEVHRVSIPFLKRHLDDLDDESNEGEK